MSIFIIRGPEASGQLIRTAQPLPAPVLKALVHRAIDAGTTVAIRACGSEQELLDALRVGDGPLQWVYGSRVKRHMLIIEFNSNEMVTSFAHGVPQSSRRGSLSER